MEPFEDVYAMNPGEDPEFGSKTYRSRNHDLGPEVSDSDKDGFVYLWLQSLRLEDDGEGGMDSGEEENADGKTEAGGGDGDSQYGWDFADENMNFGGLEDNVGWGEMGKKGDRSGSSYRYPLRPDAEDCVFYLKTGRCKFGSICKFNHPVRRTLQYYVKIDGSKFGRSCRCNHLGPKESDNSVVELNIVGLPIRPYEKECSYYMRTGFCKYGADCKFNHPDPPASVQSTSLRSGNDGSQSPRDSFKSANTSWSSSSTRTETVPSVAVASIYPSERRMLQPKGYVMNSPTRKTHLRGHQHKQIPIEEFPERPGQPECNYFVRTGDCWFKHTCKYHHPKNLTKMSTRCMFNEEGLPLRPGESVCVYYSLYGICKFGPACKFDHPIGLAYWTGD